MKSMIFEFLKHYGWQLTLLACSGIIFLGALKSLGLFKKLPDKYKKYVYFGSSAFISLIACTIYILAIHKFEWEMYALLVFGVIGFTGGIYTVYENTGFRDFLKKFVFSQLKKLVKHAWISAVNNSLTEDTVKDLALGLGVEAIKEIEQKAVEIQAEKDNAVAESEAAEKPAEEEQGSVITANARSNIIITERK